MPADTYLVKFEYGHGAVYGLVRADSVEQVQSAGPELVILDHTPECFNATDIAELVSRVIDLATMGHKSLVEEILLSRLTAGRV